MEDLAPTVTRHLGGGDLVAGPVGGAGLGAVEGLGDGRVTGWQGVEGAGNVGGCGGGLLGLRAPRCSITSPSFKWAISPTRIPA